MRNQRTARALLRLYPRAWRERYADEFLALVEESAVTPRVVVNIAGGAARERVRSIFARSQSDAGSSYAVAATLLLMIVKPLVLAAVAWFVADALAARDVARPFGGYWLSFVIAGAIGRLLPAQIAAAWRKRGRRGLGRAEIGVWTTAVFVLAVADAWPGAGRPEFWVFASRLLTVMPLLDLNSRVALARAELWEQSRRRRMQQWILEHSTRLHLDR